MSAHKSGPPRRKRRTVDAPKRLQYATCATTGKRGYFSKRDAKVARSQLPSSTLSLFRCEHCGYFHLGHLPIGVRAGAISRAAYNEAARRRAA